MCRMWAQTSGAMPTAHADYAKALPGRPSGQKFYLHAPCFIVPLTLPIAQNSDSLDGQAGMAGMAIPAKPPPDRWPLSGALWVSLYTHPLQPLSPPEKKTINRVLSASKVIARVQQRKRKLLRQKNNSGKWKCVTCVIAQLNWIFHTFLQLPVMVRSGQDGCRGVWGILLDYGPATGEKSINTRLVWNTIQTTEF